MTLRDRLAELAERIGRGKGGFGIAPTPGQAKWTLAVGAPNVIRVKGGHIVAIGLDVESVRDLREQCDAILRDVDGCKALTE